MIVNGEVNNRSCWIISIITTFSCQCSAQYQYEENGEWRCVQGGHHSVDITQQNMVTWERSVTPHNSEVEQVAVSGDGQYMATVDCLWADQVEFPHFSNP